eukprot:Stramenopile-MAST_4_protein_4726
MVRSQSRCATTAAFLACVVLVQQARAVDKNHVLDVREAMVKDAVDVIVAEFNNIGSSYNKLLSVCPQIGDFEFADMCMPSDEFESVNRHYDEITKVTTNIKYDDTRPKDGKNSPKDMKMSDKFQVNAGQYLGFKIQPETEKSDSVKAEMCAAEGVGKTFKQHSVGESKWSGEKDLASSTSWQYFGGQQTGLFAQFPATIKTQCWCDKYDPRYRPWYASAVTGPKDIIMVLDVSGSMADENRLAIMKEAAIAQMDTVTFLDYVQVVQYSSNAKSEGSSLLQGTDENKKRLVEYINNLKSGGSTNGEAGVRLAFDIFKSSKNSGKTSGCTRIISFLTDGVLSSDSFIDRKIPAWQSGLNVAGNSKPVHFFTYALGSGAQTDSLKKMSCNNNGWLAQVEDGKPEELKRAMVGYFEYFANKISLTANATARWSDFYIDSSGQGLMTTVSLPVFTNEGSYRKFHGVVGIDVAASDFGKNLDDNAYSATLKARANKCQAFDLSIAYNGPYIQDACVVKRSEGIGTPIPTGATINEVNKDCMSYFPWWGFLLIFGGLALLSAGCFLVKKMGGRTRGTRNYGQSPQGRPPQVQMQAVQVNQVHYPNQQMGIPAQQGYPQANPAFPQQQPMYANQMQGVPGMQMQGVPGMQMQGVPGMQMQGVPVVQANAQMYSQAQTRQF